MGKHGRHEKYGVQPTRIPHLYHVHYSKEDQFGCLVRLHRSRGHVEELFSFSQYPNKQACFTAAKKRAREVEILYPRLTRREYAQIRRSNFKNNEVGVRKVTKTIKDSQYDFWEASWSPCVGVVKKKRFSVHKYGDEEAHKLARVARAEGLIAMDRHQSGRPRRDGRMNRETHERRNETPGRKNGRRSGFAEI